MICSAMAMLLENAYLCFLGDLLSSLILMIVLAKLFSTFPTLIMETTNMVMELTLRARLLGRELIRKEQLMGLHLERSWHFMILVIQQGHSIFLSIHYFWMSGGPMPVFIVCHGVLNSTFIQRSKF